MIYKRKFNKGGMFLQYSYDDKKGASSGASSSANSGGDKEEKSMLDDELIHKAFLKGDMLDNEIDAFKKEWKKVASGKNPFLNSNTVDSTIDLSASLITLKNNKEQWLKAHEIAKSSGGLGEIAVGDSGELYVMDENRQVSSISISEFKKKKSGSVRALSVAELLEQRNSNAALAGQNGIFNVANNSIGISKITNYAKDIISKIGTEKKSSERVYDQDTVMGMRKRIQEELQSGRVPSDDEVRGFAVLDAIASSPSQYNMVKEDHATQKKYAVKAVNYIWTTMDQRARNKLSAQAALSNQEPTQLLLDLVEFSSNETHNSSVKPISESEATTGDKTGTSGSTGGKNMNNPQMVIGGDLGRGEVFEINDPDGGTKFAGITIGKSALTTPQGDTIPATTLNKILATGWNQVLDINNVYFGNTRVDATQLAEIAVDGMSEMGNVYLPVNPSTGGPDNRSLQLFRQAMDKYEELKDDPNITNQDIEAMFNSLSFDVTILPDKTLDVKAKGGNVKPFWITFAYTNNASQLVKDNDDISTGGLRRLTKNEHNRITPITDEAFIKYNRDGSSENIRPNKRLKSERTYKGIVAIPLRDGAVANMDALVGAGPKKPDYSNAQVRYNAQGTSGVPFNQTSAQQLKQQ